MTEKRPVGRPSKYSQKISDEICAEIAMGHSSVSYIYALSHPISEEVRYIGKTDFPKQRKYAHQSKQYGCTHRKKWIMSILNAGLKPKFKILQIVSSKKWQEAERSWIAKYKNIGSRLVNYDDGGIGATSGGIQNRVHFIKRELINNYNMFKKRNPVIADRIATKLRFLYLVIPDCPKKWERIGLNG